MNIARRLAPLASTVLLIAAGAASAFAVNIDTGAVNIDTGAQPPSAAWKGLVPCRWWLVFGVTVVAVLVQALAGLLDSSADVRQVPSRGRHLAPRYVLFSAVWLLGVAAVALALGFRDAWKEPELYFVAVGTIAVVTFVEYIRSIRLSPLSWLQSLRILAAQLQLRSRWRPGQG